MNKLFRRATVIFVLVVFILPILGCKKKDTATNQEAEKKKEEELYLTVINDTGNILTKVVVTIGEGTEILETEDINTNSFSLLIPEEFRNESTYNITCIDNYEFKYGKSIEVEDNHGRYEVKISKDNRIPQDGDWWREVEQFFNQK